MSSTQLSRRWERLSEGRYVATLERPKRPADTPIEQHEHDTTQEQLLQPTPDLLPLPTDVPRSGRVDIEDIAMPSQSSASSSVPVAAQPIQGSEVQAWFSQAKAELLPSNEASIINAFSFNKVDISANQVRDIVIMSIELGAVDILEVFSPKRFTDPILCSKLGLRSGFAVDLSECKPYGPTAG